MGTGRKTITGIPDARYATTNLRLKKQNTARTAEQRWMELKLMAEYHVGCGLAGIYAGTLNKKKDMWINKSDVTNEAIKAVINHMYFQIPEGENAFAYAVKMNSGKYARLKIEVTDECPEWAKDQLEGPNETD